MENSTDIKRLELSPESIRHLNTTRKWTMFFAILGFIFLGMMIFAGIAAGAFLSIFNPGPEGADIPQWLFVSILLFFAVLYFFPVLFLFRFSSHMRNAVQEFSNEDLRKAFRNLRAFFAYIGILFIIMLAFYFIAILVAGASLAFLKTIG